jgi:uncharacterized membrane protein YgcG
VRSSPSFRLLSALSWVLLLLVLGWEGLPAQERSLTIQHFHSDIQVQEDGGFRVTETLSLRFTGSWNGIDRELSLDHRTAQGRRGRLRVEVGEITDDQGRPLEVERSGGRNRVDLRIWIPGARDTVRTVVIPYRVRDGIRFFEDGNGTPSRDELYYNVTGTDWRIPIEGVTARIRLPAGIEALETWGYTGPAGATERAVEIEEEEDGSSLIRTTRSFGPGEGLAVSVSWPAGAVARPSAAAQAGGTLRAHWPLGLPLLAMVTMGRLWLRKGRDPQGRALMAEYEPPEGLTPAEAGTLVDHRAEIHDITSILVDLAVRGYVRIEELPGDRRPAFLGGRKEDWAFHMRRPRRDWEELAVHERAFMEGLFPPEEAGASLDLGDALGALTASFGAWRAARREDRGFDAHSFMGEWIRKRREAEGEEEDEADASLASVKLSELQNRFYTHLEGIRTKIYGALKEKGLYLRRPDHQVQRWAGFGLVLVVLGVFTWIAMEALSQGGGLLPEPWAAAVGVGLSGLVVVLVGQGMGVRTEAGVEARDRVQGFREFLSRVESDYYRRVVLTPELFERYLPWAIALRVDARWARAFEGISREPPDWYAGGAPGTSFRATAFAAQMGSLSTQAGRSFSSSPSGSSGSGGGGSSGGGSGGGGGGGF